MPDDISVKTQPPHKGAAEKMRTSRDPKVMRVLAAAISTFGSDAKAWHWLERPTGLLDGASPLSVLETSSGPERIEHALGRIDHGLAV